MYMQPYKCKVTNVSATAAKQLAKAEPPAYCANDQSKCVSGAKQMIVFNQREGDNTEYGSGQGPSPAYNGRNGFRSGAQNNIFVEQPTTDVPTGTSTASAMQSSISTSNPTASSSTPSGVKDNVQTSTGTAPASASTATTPSDAPTSSYSVLPISGSHTAATSSVHSYTTTVTGRIGRPTKFTCYAEED